MISDSSIDLFNMLPTGAVLTGVVLCYLLSGGRLSVSLALVISFIIFKKQGSEESEGADDTDGEKPKKKGCCGGKNGGCSGHKLDEFGMPAKKKGCCGGACKTKKVEDPTPIVEVGYDNEVDFTDSFKR